MASIGHGKTLQRADPTTIQDKFMVGYQGWFTCAGDGPPIGPGHHGWLHWFNYPIPDGGRPNTDLWPDTSEYSPSELYSAPGLKYQNGEQAYLFSSRHPRTVERHFHWMALHGVDGAFLQRFSGQTDIEKGNEGIRNQRDEIGDRVREAAEKERRVFAIMYDVSGVDPNRIQRVIEQDWHHLLHDKRVLDSPSYLHEKGRPVICLWGFGLDGRKHSPHVVRAITHHLRSVTPGGAYIIAGIAAHWRTSQGDADRNPEFVNVWLEDFDAISPWTIGRYGDEDAADRFAEEKIKGDVELLRRRAEEGKKRVDYMPVVYPGGSGFNLSEGKWGMNDIKRNGGRFLWRQLWNARRNGIRIIYGAMWDEYDEGTAYLPVVSHKRQAPVSDKYQFIALDADGYDLPSDWFMRICGFAVEGLRGDRIIQETFPVKELQDYWSNHPRYVVRHGHSSSSASASGSGAARSYEQWVAEQGARERDEPPPPPYSLEADGGGAGPSSQLPRPAPPELPMSTRPLSIHHDHHHHSANPNAPPPIPSSYRPPVHNPPHASLQNASIDSLAEDFGRQTLSSPRPSTSPRPDAPPLHPSRLSPSPSPHPRPQGAPPPPQHPTRISSSSYPSSLPGPQDPYTPGYMGAPPPPPLRPRPSGSHSPPARPSPPPRLSSSSAYRPSQDVVQFPQAHPSPPFQPPWPYQPENNWQDDRRQEPAFPQPYGGTSSCPAPYQSGAYPPPPPLTPRPPGGLSPPPPLPGRPSQPPSSPSMSSGSLRTALSSVDRIAPGASGRIERGVGSLTQTGNKSFNKFSK